MLDGFGSFVAPPPTARPVPSDFSGSASADHPPGFYGPPESLLAVNTLAPHDRLAPLDFSALATASHEIYRTSEPQDLRGPIFLIALSLLLLDTLVVLFLGGGIQRLIPRGSRTAAAAVIVAYRACAHAGAGARPGRNPQSGRAAIGAGNQTRLRDHRRCRRRRDQQIGPCRPHALSRAAHRARTRRSDRARHRPRRACVLSADLLADRARRAAALRGRAQAHRHLHEGRRHRVVRYPRCRRGAARPGRRDATVRACSNCAKFCPRSTSRNSSRCRAITS